MAERRTVGIMETLRPSGKWSRAAHRFHTLMVRELWRQYALRVEFQRHHGASGRCRPLPDPVPPGP